MMQHKIQGLYAITDPNLIADDRLYDSVSEAIDGGINILQYRNKNAPELLQYQQAELLQKLCSENSVTFIVNDDIHLANKVGADGVHLGRDDQSILAARQILGSDAIIGLSCYNQIERAIKAEQTGADYIAFGRFFPSSTKPDAVQASPELISKARQKIHIPIVAIGGINPHNISILVKAGADSFAVIHSVFSADSIKNSCMELVNKIKL